MRRIRRKEKGGERQVNLFQFPHVPWPACPFTYSLHPTCGDPKGVAYSLKPVSIADVRRRSTRCSPLRLSLTLSVKPLFVQDSPKDPPRFESNAAISPRFKRFLERGGTRFHVDRDGFDVFVRKTGGFVVRGIPRIANRTILLMSTEVLELAYGNLFIFFSNVIRVTVYLLLWIRLSSPPLCVHWNIVSRVSNMSYCAVKRAVCFILYSRDWKKKKV